MLRGAEPEIHASLMEELKEFAAAPRKRNSKRHQGQGSERSVSGRKKPGDQGRTESTGGKEAEGRDEETAQKVETESPKLSDLTNRTIDIVEESGNDKTSNDAGDVPNLNFTIDTGTKRAAPEDSNIPDRASEDPQQSNDSNKAQVSNIDESKQTKNESEETKNEFKETKNGSEEKKNESKDRENGEDSVEQSDERVEVIEASSPKPEEKESGKKRREEGMSIVDRIKNKQVKPATPKAERRASLKLSAIAEERSIVTTNKETGNPNNLELDVRISTGSAPTENISGAPRKAGLRVAVDRVMREKSAAREVSLPRELANRLVSLSRADISQELRQSCVDLVGSGTQRPEDLAAGRKPVQADAANEKEFLLNRLHQLLDQERKQVGKDLEARKTQLKEVKEFHRNEDALLTKVHTEQLEEMWRRQELELLEVEEEAEDRAEHLRKEIELLENEMGQLPAEMVSALEEQARLAGGAEASATANTSKLSELELELQCCSCQEVCRPPARIYQCPEGDLLCGACLPPKVLSCPDCGIDLDGNTSRNKVLEKLAVKYF